ncbi:MAG: hypothetical protein HOV81_44540 [Kofleriaceae bacterium]|nr:hypothetical protein [Kofleriaceae bacterium]
MTRQLVTIVAAVLALSSNAYAQLSKEACVDAHSRGQDAREQGKLSLARKLFLTCAQSSCPAAVQGDCARFADDLTNLQPTIVFVARDASGNDLPATTVYVDGALVATSIDGKPHDIDPGNHVVKFSNGDSDEVITLVIGSGEKGRTVLAKFSAINPPSTPDAAQTVTSRPAKPAARKVQHPKGALALAVSGGIVAIGGGALAFYGRSQVPEACDLSTHQCAAPPGAPVFDDAASAANKVNIGLIAGGVGVAALAGGLVWYYAGAKTDKESPTQQSVAPWVNGNGAGVAVLGRF